MFEFDNDVLIGRILWPLLKRQNQKTNFGILKNAINKGESLATITREIALIGQQQGKMGATVEPKEGWFVSAEQLLELEGLVVKKIRKAAKDNSLLNFGKVNGILYRWKEWANPEEVRKWAEEIIKKDQNLLLLLTKFLGKSYSYSTSGTKIKYRLDPKWLEDFIDVDKIMERVRKLSRRRNLTIEQKTALDILIREYGLRKQGKDPDNPLSDY